MSIVQKSKKVIAEKLIVLKKTRKIEEQDLILPEWILLTNEYKDNADAEWIDKALVSMLNSIIFQRRVVFVMARRAFRDLVQADRNWGKAIGLKNENWSKLIHEATQRDLIKVVHQSRKGRYVYELVSQEILDVLCIDKDKQLREAIKFAEQMSEDDEGTRKGTTQGDRESETERELDRQADQTSIEGEGKEEQNKLSHKPFNSQDGKRWVKNAGDIGDQRIEPKHYRPENCDATGLVDSPQRSAPTPDEIILAWKGQFDGDAKHLEFLSLKNAPQNLADLVATFTSYGYQPSHIPVKQVIKLTFGPNSRLTEWIEQTEMRLKSAIAKASNTVQVQKATPEMAPEAKAIYDRLVKEGKTPADLHGMSLYEYALQRAHADSFPVLNIERPEERMLLATQTGEASLLPEDEDN